MGNIRAHVGSIRTPYALFYTCSVPYGPYGPCDNLSPPMTSSCDSHQHLRTAPPDPPRRSASRDGSEFYTEYFTRVHFWLFSNLSRDHDPETRPARTPRQEVVNPSKREKKYSNILHVFTSGLFLTLADHDPEPRPARTPRQETVDPSKRKKKLEYFTRVHFWLFLTLAATTTQSRDPPGRPGKRWSIP